MHNTTHSIMFHHFHDVRHLPTQGSLSSADFIKMIDWLNSRYSLLNASDYKSKLEKGELNNSDICISFDDGLKCQYDIAFPILKKLGIEAFVFVYSSTFSDKPDELEIYRYFRTNCFKSINEFYFFFFYLVENANPKKYISEKNKYQNFNYLPEFPFYTENDKWFRYVRDQYLEKERYDEIMHQLMKEKSFDVTVAKKTLWMSEKELVNADAMGHIIGLHSYSHPTQISKLTKEEQKLEYKKNYEHLSELIGKPIYAMSHPCGDYNESTLEILQDLDISIGFRSNMAITDINSPLEVPREDHANVYRQMNL